MCPFIGEPSTVCQNVTSRYNEPFVLTCNITTGDEPDKWRINGSIITKSDKNYIIEGSKMNIHNVEAAIFWNRATRFECSVSEGGVTFTGSPYILDPEGKRLCWTKNRWVGIMRMCTYLSTDILIQLVKSLLILIFSLEILFVPNLLSNSSTPTAISITWEDLSVYFNVGSFNYSLRWRVNGTVEWLQSTWEEIRNPNFTISELKSNMPYEILLTVSNNSVSVNRTFILSTAGKTSTDRYIQPLFPSFVHALYTYVCTYCVSPFANMCIHAYSECL